MRSLLFEPFDKSRSGGWALVGLVAIVAVVIGLGVGGAFGARVRGGAPLGTADMLRLARSGRPGLRVLFVGNSFTAANSMVGMVMSLEKSHRLRPRPVFGVEFDPSGGSLQQADGDPALQRLLRATRWNLVVLQEQSARPSLPDWLLNSTFTASRDLVLRIRAIGATPLLFETWGYRNGDLADYGGDDYVAMQARLRAGYAAMGSRELVTVAPVGDAWELALRENPSAPLWADDGHHPSEEGSYLAAAVLAAMLDTSSAPAQPLTELQQSTYTAGLIPVTAAWLRRIAIRVVLQDTRY